MKEQFTVELRRPVKGELYIHGLNILEAKSNFGTWPGCERWVVVSKTVQFIVGENLK